MADRELKPFELTLDGKCIKSIDPSLIGKNFQTLKNLRYTDTNPKAIGGMTKVNATTALANPKIRSGFHFRKDQPSETHLLVQSKNAGETASYVYENTTTIPSQGDFVGTALHTDASGADLGRFSNAPDGAMIYCNSKETMIYGGNESRCVAFINTAIDQSFEYDFTTQINNTINDDANTAILKRVTETVDANTMLLLHLDNNVTDSSPTTPHTVTNANVTFSTSIKKYGTHAGYLNGTDAKLTVPDNPDFDCSGGIWTYELWAYPLAPAGSGTYGYTIYYQEIDATHWIWITLQPTGATGLFSVRLNIQNTTDTVTMQTASTYPINQWHHIAVCESGDTWSIFVDGSLGETVTNTERAQNYTSVVSIGGYSLGYWFKGYMDEIRVSNICRYTANFEVRAKAFGDVVTTEIEIGSTRPLSGIKPYIRTANTATAAAPIGYVWTGTWTALTNISDGTLADGKSLAQTGSITFDTTVDTATTDIRHARFLYWYKFVWTDIDDSVKIYYCTVKTPLQPLRDIWDGTLRGILTCKVIRGSSTYDYSVNVYSDTYDSNDASTYAKFGQLATSTGYIVIRFNERMQGFCINFPEEYVNTTASTVMTLSYWNGSAWQSASNLNDGTVSGGISFAKTGYVTWTPPALYSEYKKSISGEMPLYYYKISFNKTLSGSAKADIRASFIGGIPVAQTISNYKFSFMDANRLYLCSNQDEKKNEILALGADSNCIANGEDSIKIPFGGEAEITAGGSLYAELRANIYDMKVICKKSEVWAFTGSTPDTFDKKKIYSTDGCVAPLTFDIGSVNIGDVYRPVAIWQGANGLYLFDGTSVNPISEDISNFFDKKETTKIYSAMIHKSVGKIDPENQEYHWLFATGTSTTLNNEWVYDIKRNKWYEIDRGTKDLQCLIPVMDTYGNSYLYGSLDTGYLERLEYGTTLDGDDITFTVQTGDVAIEAMVETKIHNLKFNAVAKTTTTNSISITHYGDSSTTATPKTPYTVSAQNSGKRLVNSVKSIPLGDFVYHSFKATMTTNNENVGFEPLSIGGLYKSVRPEVR